MARICRERGARAEAFVRISLSSGRLGSPNLDDLVHPSEERQYVNFSHKHLTVHTDHLYKAKWSKSAHNLT